ncbi:MAG: SCO6880 family protein [Acidimicrobiales bacterium]
MSSADSAGGRYRFGPLERKGLVAGLGGGQVVCVGAGLLGAVGAIRLLPMAVGLAAAAAAVAVGLGAGFVPVSGRTSEEWAPVIWGWGRSRLSGTWRWFGRAHQRGAPGPEPPPALRGSRVLEHRSAGAARMGVVIDGRDGTCSAAVGASGAGFALLDPEDKQRRLAGWAAVLAGLAREGSVVHRLQWIEAVHPGDADGLELSMAERLDPDAPPGAAGSYAELIGRAGPLTPRHETLVVLSVSPLRIRRLRGALGGRSGALDLLAAEMAMLESGLRSADIEVSRTLSAVGLGSALAAGFHGGSGHWRSPWPMAVESTWSSVRTDGAWHATYWVAEWPRTEVGPDFLVPLLLMVPAVRVVSVTMEPVGPKRAAREVESARTGAAADEELRRRGGFMATARRQRQAEGMARREAELADGHADIRFSGYVTVTASEPSLLERSCSEVERAAAQSRLDLRRLYGQQEEALTYTLPLGRGLR